jgi:hypothetical protein
MRDCISSLSSLKRILDKEDLLSKKFKAQKVQAGFKSDAIQ